MGQVTVDFVAHDQPHGGYALILVEQGPWATSEVAEKLRHLQDRLYACLDAALDGQVAAKYPDSRGLPILIRVDAYDIDSAELPEFFDRFAAGVLAVPDYAKAVAEQQDYPSVQFTLELGSTVPSNTSLERARGG